MRLRKRMWEILDVAREGDSVSRAFDIGILTLIFLNVVAVILGSVASIYDEFSRAFDIFENVSIAVFAVEYLARVWSCTIDPRFSGPVRGRLRFAFSPMALVDLIAILPFFVPYLGLDFRAIRILRLLRILRVAKVWRYYAALQLMGNVFKAKKEELVLTGVVMVLILVLSSTLLFYAESSAQPKVFSSIPAAMWWAVATLTTVGYGDMYPVTAFGKICAGIIEVLGIGMFAIPTGILGAGFVEEIQMRKTKRVCPHCGKEFP